MFSEEWSSQNYFLGKLYKEVVGSSGKKFGLHMLMLIEQIKVFSYIGIHLDEKG